MYSKKVTIAKFVYGYDQLARKAISVGDLTLTTSRAAYDSKAINKMWRSFQTHELAKLFPQGIRVITRNDVGRLHIHCAVSLPFSVEGFDWASFEQANRWHTIYSSTKLPSALKWYKHFYRIFRKSMSAEYRKLFTTLRAKAKQYGFGYTTLLPIRKNNNAYKWYLVKNIPTIRQKRDKGLHYISSWGLDTTGEFKVLSNGYNNYRARMKKFAEGLHLSYDNCSIVLRELLGKSWHWKCRDFIKNIDALGSLAQKYKELRQTVKQYLVRTDQYDPQPKRSQT